MSDDRLRDELREAAETYRPDRGAIASRVAARRAAQQRRQRLRPITAGAGVAVVVAVSVVAVRAGAGEPEPPQLAAPGATAPATSTSDPAASTSPPARTPVSSPDAGASGAPGSAPGGIPTGAPTGGGPNTGGPNGSGPGGGPGGIPTGGTPAGPGGTPPGDAGSSGLTVTGSVAKQSVATWTQNTVIVRNTKPVTGFRVVITVPLTPGLDEAGRYATVPNADVSMSVERESDALVYTYVMKKSLRPGTYEFGAQFNHRSGRGGDGDRFHVTGKAGGTESEQDGRFQ